MQNADVMRCLLLRNIFQMFPGIEFEKRKILYAIKKNIRYVYYRNRILSLL